MELDTCNPIRKYELQLIDDCINRWERKGYVDPIDTLVECTSGSQPYSKSTFDADNFETISELLPELLGSPHFPITDEPDNVMPSETRRASKSVHPISTGSLAGVYPSLEAPKLEVQSERPVLKTTYLSKSEAEKGRHGAALQAICGTFGSSGSDMRAISVEPGQIELDPSLFRSFVRTNLTGNSSESETATFESESVKFPFGPHHVPLEMGSLHGVSAVWPQTGIWSGLELAGSSSKLSSSPPIRDDSSINSHS